MISPVALVICETPIWRRRRALDRAVSRFALAIGVCPMLETARTGARVGSLQECSSIGRAPVSKTGGRRFEPCHSCQLNQILKPIFRRWPAIPAGRFPGDRSALPARLYGA